MSPAPTRAFRVVIADTLFYEIDVTAADEGQAHEVAWDVFASDDRPDAARGACEIISLQEVAS